ncbi:galactose-1-phosphate uridylyltransferase [Planoprotostelium fungivorum]|uniref:Galactose-1-phosphate uridylyltransferase n=1 Tax=Planoprotostelium fungivorum TaxID=1890364 RepID=A0A2P6N1U6_9EUKA|nr:galactose-1-phosphate uridylyltransferase [Planoprotostelium fungivorum]
MSVSLISRNYNKSYMSAEKEWDTPHRRFNPLLNSWILCSPHRAKRPWQGQVEKASTDKLPQYDPKCFLCPRNQRVATGSGESPFNPDYKDTFVFTNDFSALLPAQESESAQVTGGLFQSESASGMCKVICFSPRHDLTLSQMEAKDIVKVVDTWRDQYEQLSKSSDIQYVLIFENRGEMMGCSNPHPHCQIWSSSYVPQDPKTELTSFSEYETKNHSCLLCDYVKMELEKKVRVVSQNDTFVAMVPYWALNPHPHCQIWSSSYVPQDPKTELASFSQYETKNHSCLLCDYVKMELEKKVRVVSQNDTFVAMVPYWALWPYELLVLPKKHVSSLSDFTAEDTAGFADILNKVTCMYDNLFKTSFPYSMGIHQSPTPAALKTKEYEGMEGKFHFHAHLFPPLLRSATVKKFMVGFELLGEPQRDITAEQSAATLSKLSQTVHFSRENQ